MWFTLLRWAGALLNRIRGGLWDPPVNKIYYPLFLGLVTNNIFTPIGAYAGQQICGWGAYIGSITTGVAPATECKWIDWCVQKLTKYPRLWGSAALAIRGLVWTRVLLSVLVTSGLLLEVCLCLSAILFLQLSCIRHSTIILKLLGILESSCGVLCK